MYSETDLRSAVEAGAILTAMQKVTGTGPSSARG